MTVEAPSLRVQLDRRAIGRYVLGRRTPEGGYSFYRMPAWGVEEPNAPDTLAALESLHLLGVATPRPEQTAAFLRGLQDEDGGYPTLVIGWATLRSLDDLGLPPTRPPIGWIEGWEGALLAPYRAASHGSSDSLSAAVRLLDLMRLTGRSPGTAARAAVKSLVDAGRGPDGWPRADAGLAMIGEAIGLLTLARLPVPDRDGAARVLRRCEDPVLGYRMAPDAAATGSGTLLAGLQTGRALNMRPRYPAAVAHSLQLLQRPDGGLGARHRALSTLQDTWRGLQAAALLEEEAR